MMEVSMDPTLFLHLDADFLWRWYITDAMGNLVPVSRPYFDRAEAEEAMRAHAMPLAA